MTERSSVLPYVFEWGPNMSHLRQGDGVVCGKKIKQADKIAVLFLAGMVNRCEQCFGPA